MVPLSIARLTPTQARSTGPGLAIHTSVGRWRATGIQISRKSAFYLGALCSCAAIIWRQCHAGGITAVAPIGNRPAVPGNRGVASGGAACRVPLGDTADCQSALLPKWWLGVPPSDHPLIAAWPRCVLLRIGQRPIPTPAMRTASPSAAQRRAQIP